MHGFRVRKTKREYYKLVGWLMATLAPAFIFAQVGPPDLTCVQTDILNNITFQWEIPADPGGEFTEYEIWKGTTPDMSDAVPWATVDTYAQNTFSWVAAMGDINLSCFSIRTKWTDGGSQQYSEFSDTLCNILLSAQNSVPGGMAELSWQGPYTPTGAPAGEVFEIWKQTVLDGWFLLDTVPIDVHEYEEVVEDCGALFGYQIRVAAIAGCTSESNIVQDIFSDGTPPDIPSITVVSVDSVTGNAVINWNPSVASDTWGYIIYECDQFGEQPVDTIYVQDADEFENPFSTANLWSESYLVAAFDSCLVAGNFLNLSPTDGNCHETILLSPPSWFNCQDYLTLNWSHYEGWPDGVSHYEIIFREDGSLDQIAGSVQGDVNTFIHENLNFGSTYKYFIKAYANGAALTSLSNGTPPITIQVDQAPQDNYLMTATVAGKNEIFIGVQTIFGANGLPHEYILERKDAPDDDYDFVATQWFSGGSNVISFSDYDVDTRFTDYEYRVQVMNDCGDTVETTNVGHTMQLSGLANDAQMVNTILWNDYEAWDIGVDYYNIYRSFESGVPGQLIATIGASQSFYEDDVSDLIHTPGYFCYTVEAVEIENQYGYSMTSISNEVCLQQEPRVWIPNAFMINGNNSSFFPVISFADFETYKMIVYSRWGDIIYTTPEHDGTWDIPADIPWRGKKDGTLVPEGAYAYYIEIRDGRGQQHEYRGAVYMLIGAAE